MPSADIVFLDDQSVCVVPPAEEKLGSAALIAAAEQAARQGDLDAALLTWHEVRHHFPEIISGWLRPAQMLTELRRLPEADALLADAVDRFPDDFWLARARATIPRLQARHDEALTRYRALRYRFPHETVARSDFVACLLDIGNVAGAEAEAATGLAVFPNFRWLLHQYAMCAEAADRNDAAAERWSALLVRHPTHSPAYAKAVAALAAVGRLNDAATLGAEALRLAPDDDLLRAAYQEAAARADPAMQVAAGAATAALVADAEAATAAADWLRAAWLWAAVRAQQPSMPRAHAALAQALVHQSRAAEATLVLLQAQRDLPPDADGLAVWAELAVEHADLDEALRRYEALRTAFPDAPAGTCGIARVLLQTGRLADAEDLFPILPPAVTADAALRRLRAQVATARCDWRDAVPRWRAVVAVAPDNPADIVALADALLARDEWSEADAVLAEALERLPDDRTLARRWAQSATEGTNPADATERWATLRVRFPDDATIADRLADCLLALGRTQEAEDVLAEAAAAFPRSTTLAAGFANAAAARGDAAAFAARWAMLPTLPAAQGDGWRHAPQPIGAAPADIAADAPVAIALSTSRDRLDATLGLLVHLTMMSTPGSMPAVLVLTQSEAEGARLGSQIAADTRLADVVVRLLAGPTDDASHTRLAGVRAAFDAGAALVAWLDDGTKLLWPTDLSAMLRDVYRRHEYRYRHCAEPEPAWLAAVQSVWPGLSDRHPLRAADGRHDNLRLYEKATFNAFSQFLLTTAEPQRPAADDPAAQLAARLLDDADDWAAYIAHVLLAAHRPPAMKELTGIAAMFGADDAADVWDALRAARFDKRLLTALNPPALPWTTDRVLWRMARAALPPHVCLMLPPDQARQASAP